MTIEKLQWVYQLSDFETSGGNIAPPDEQGARAQGSPPFNLQLKPTAQPIQVQVNDGGNDGFDEISSANQVLDAPVTIDGTTYPAGTRIFVNYGLEDANGLRVYSITIGGTNSGNNTTTALISEGPLTPGQQYTFIQEFNIGRNEVDYANLACFCGGTMIATPGGERPIESLSPGDLVMTLDHGPQPLRHVARSVCLARGDMAPVVFADGAIGNKGKLRVSPNHRMLVRGPKLELLTGFREALVAAKHMVNGRTIIRAEGMLITYFHLLFDRHEIVLSNGVPSESFYPDNALGPDSALSDAETEVLAEQRMLFPGLAPSLDAPASAARPCLKKYEAIALIHG